MKRSISLLLVLAMALCLLAGCGQGGKAQAKDSITIMSAMACESIDPYSGSYSEVTTPRMVFDTLVDYDDKGGFVPCLAKSWTDDGVNVSFELRDDVYFTDGEHFTADDVVFAFNKYAENPAFAARMQLFDACEKTGEFSVTFHKPSPYAAIMNGLAEMFMVVSHKAYEKDPEGFAKNPIGSGPYKYVSEDADGTFHFVANEKYFQGEPKIKNLTIKPPVDPSTAVIALQSGDIDLLANPAIAQKKLIDDDKNLEFVAKNAYIMTMLMLCGPKFTDINLRKAVYYALDLESVVLIGNEGLGAPATDIAAQRTMGDLRGKVKFGEYDLDKAKEYLAKANIPAGEKYRICVTPDFAGVAQVIQDCLGKIGLAVEVEQMDLNSLYARMFANDVDLTVTYIGNRTTTIEVIVSAYAIPPFNIMQPTDEMMGNIGGIMSIVDAKEREALVLKQIEAIKENADYIPLFEFASTLAYNKNLKGVEDFSAATYLYYVNRMSW